MKAILLVEPKPPAPFLNSSHMCSFRYLLTCSCCFSVSSRCMTSYAMLSPYLWRRVDESNAHQNDALGFEPSCRPFSGTPHAVKDLAMYVSTLHKVVDLRVDHVFIPSIKAIVDTHIFVDKEEGWYYA